MKIIQISWQSLIRTYGPWLAFLAAPLLINGILCKTFVAPQKSELKAWREAQALLQFKPKLKSLLAESYRVRLEGAETGVTRKDSQGVLQAIQKSAGRHGVQIKETRMKGQVTLKEADAKGTIPLELEVTGSFSKLARWMNDMEAEPDFQIDTWLLRSSDSDQTLHLTVKVTAFVGET